jgi:hypothetical protein
MVKIVVRHLGIIQVLRQHVFDLFQTHPPYQQKLAFVHTHLRHDVNISSYLRADLAEISNLLGYFSRKAQRSPPASGASSCKKIAGTCTPFQ